MALLSTLFGGLAFIAGMASLVCCILVLVQMFKRAGVGLGIVGIITCGWGAYIWGWIKAKEFGLTKIMLGWTAAIVVMIIAYVGIAIFAVGSLKDNPDFQKAMKKATEEAAKKSQEK